MALLYHRVYVAALANSQILVLPRRPYISVEYSNFMTIICDFYVIS